MRILAVCGSLQSESKNLTLLRVAAERAPGGVAIVIFDGLGRLPLFNPDLQAEGEPDAVRVWREAVAESAALLIASPEYGHSLPGALKNAIDWLISSGELERKPVAITAATSGPERGRLGLSALRQTLGAVSARVVGGEPTVLGDDFERSVESLVGELIETAKEDATAYERGIRLLSRDASGLRHLRWGREVLATLLAHEQHNALLSEPQRAALQSEAERLRRLVDGLSAAVKPYRDFLERTRVGPRGAQRVGRFLLTAAPRPEAEAAAARFDAELLSLEDRVRRPLKAKLSAAIDALREELSRLTRRLAEQTPEGLVESLFPALTYGNREVVDDPDADDDASGM